MGGVSVQVGPGVFIPRPETELLLEWGLKLLKGREHPVVVIDKNLSADKRQVVDAFIQYLWSEEAQQAFVKFHFYSSTNDAFNEANTGFGRIELPLTIEYFGEALCGVSAAFIPE